MSQEGPMVDLDPPDSVCHCYDDASHCICQPRERALRHVAAGQATMTPEQRQWCLDEIDTGVEYGYSAAEYKDSPDSDVARAVLEVWVEYCRDKGLL